MSCMRGADVVMGHRLFSRKGRRGHLAAVGVTVRQCGDSATVWQCDSVVTVRSREEVQPATGDQAFRFAVGVISDPRGSNKAM